MNKTSWTKAKIAAIAKSNWNLNVKYAIIPKQAKDKAINAFLNNSLPKVGPIELVETSSAFGYWDLMDFVMLSSISFALSVSKNWVLTAIISFVLDEVVSFTLIIWREAFSTPFFC